MNAVTGEIGDHVSPATTRKVLLLCGLAILAEGYDVGVMGAAILSLSHDPAFAMLLPFAERLAGRKHDL